MRVLLKWPYMMLRTLSIRALCPRRRTVVAPRGIVRYGSRSCEILNKHYGNKAWRPVAEQGLVSRHEAVACLLLARRHTQRASDDSVISLWFRHAEIPCITPGICR